MEQYRAFAWVYDIIMKDVDYGAWYSYLCRIWKRYGAKPNLVLDLGCGTGTFSLILSENGYEVIGVDGSPEMLAVAREKALAAEKDILFLNQPMEDFELYGTVDCIISFFDCINYILNKDLLFKAFTLVENYLNEGGLFVFDVNTRYKFEHILGENTFAENGEKCSYIWENYYDKKRRINEYELNLFTLGKDGAYEKTTEYHYQRAYGRKALEGLLRQAGFKILGVFDGYSFKKPCKRSERVFYVCGKGKG